MGSICEDSGRQRATGDIGEDEEDQESEDGFRLQHNCCEKRSVDALRRIHVKTWKRAPEDLI